MSRTVRVRGLLLILVLALAGLTGCVQIPTAGPIERVEGQSETCQNCINVEVAPPASGDEPLAVVQGFLHGDLELPAGLLHGQAVPDLDGGAVLAAGGGCDDLHRRAQG